MKGFCVSNVSIVGDPGPGSTALVADCTNWRRRRSVRSRIVIFVANDADGADGIFGPRVDPDHPGSSSAFTTEGDLDAQRAKERLHTTHVAGADFWASW